MTKAIQLRDHGSTTIKSAVIRKTAKKVHSRKQRRAAKIDPLNAPRKRCY
ncbi:MAG: hypothetical protein R3B84_20180 [Zavarzinella sp.]